MIKPEELRAIHVPEVETTFRTLSETLFQRGVEDDAPVELLDLFSRFPVIETIRDNVEACGHDGGLPQPIASVMANGGIMPLGALARYDEAHDLGLMTDLETADVTGLLASFIHRGPQAVPYIAQTYPVVEKLIDLTLEDGLVLGASDQLCNFMGQGTAYGLGVVVEMVEGGEVGSIALA